MGKKYKWKKVTKETRTCFLEKYGGLYHKYIDLYMIYKIDYEEKLFLKKSIYALISKPDHPDVTSTYHEYIPIQDNLFDIILETDQNNDIALKIISKDVKLPSTNASSTYSSSKLTKCSEIVSPCHQLRK